MRPAVGAARHKCRGYRLRCTSFAVRWLRHGSRASARRRGALGNAEPVQVGFGFERSLVSRVDSFWLDSGYYYTPSRPQRYKPIKLVEAGELVNPAGSQG
jgi:hypothetical protein